MLLLPAVESGFANMSATAGLSITSSASFPNGVCRLLLRSGHLYQPANPAASSKRITTIAATPPPDSDRPVLVVAKADAVAVVVVVVVVITDGHKSGYLDSVYLYNVDATTWRKSTKMPVGSWRKRSCMHLV